MQRVIINTEDERIVIENVSKVEANLAFDMFENKIVIHMGRKKRTFKQYQIINMVVENM